MRLSLVVLSLVTLSSGAFAEPWKLPKPGEVISRVVVESSLTRHRMMEPVSIAPDLVVGVRAKLAIALHHSRMFDGRPGAGNGICLVGARETLGSTPPDCGSGYQGAGVSLLYALSPAVTARAGVDVGDMSSVTVALDAGAIVHARSDRWWLAFAPTLFSGIANREAGNRDHVSAPLYLGADLGCGELHIRTGFDATIETAADTFSVPLGVGGSFATGGGLRIGGDVTLDRALGMLNETSWRSASVYVELDHGGGS
jgi:hypothetical protein